MPILKTLAARAPTLMLMVTLMLTLKLRNRERIANAAAG